MGITSKIRARFGIRGTAERIESYLNEATSIADLEQRQREIDRGRFSRR